MKIFISSLSQHSRIAHKVPIFSYYCVSFFKSALYGWLWRSNGPMFEWSPLSSALTSALAMPRQQDLCILESGGSEPLSFQKKSVCLSQQVLQPLLKKYLIHHVRVPILFCSKSSVFNFFVSLTCPHFSLTLQHIST